MPTWTRGKTMDELLTAFVEPKLIQPTFLTDYPTDFPGSTLAKGKPDDPAEVERFEAFAGGIEIANAFSELNDPRVQRERFDGAGRAHARPATPRPSRSTRTSCVRWNTACRRLAAWAWASTAWSCC